MKRKFILPIITLMTGMFMYSCGDSVFNQAKKLNEAMYPEGEKSPINSGRGAPSLYFYGKLYGIETLRDFSYQLNDTIRLYDWSSEKGRSRLPYYSEKMSVEDLREKIERYDKEKGEFERSIGF